MSQSVTLDIKGEHTYASDLSGVPPGSLKTALNVNINRQGIAEPRRGFDLLTYGLPSVSDRAKKLFFWNGEVFAHYGTTFAYYNTGSGFSSRGSLTAPSNATSARAVSSQNKNFYVTSDAGLKKTDAVATSLYSAGIPKGLTIDLSLTGAGTAVSNNKYVTYRYLLGRKDANSVTSTGGVSGRFTIQNAAGSTQNVTVRCYLPSGLDTTYFLQLYRSPEADSSSTFDEMQLCYETPLSSTNISNGYVDITDIVPESLLGDTIYTAPSQQGLVNDNARPPLARDIAEYKNCLFYADVDSPQRLIFSLISAGGTGLVATDTITIALGATTEVYTAHATTFDSSIKQFRVMTAGTFTFVDGDVSTGSDTITESSHPLADGDAVTLSNSGGTLPGGLSAATTYYVRDRTANTFKLAATPNGSAIDITSAAGGGTHTLSYGGSTAQNIDATIKSFIKCVNLASAIVNAYSMSESATDLPGKALVEAKSVGTATFTVVSSRAAAFQPQLPTSATINNTSTADTFPHGLAFSKAYEQEAVPIKNLFKVGRSDDRIKRIVALRDGLFIFKEQDGVYVLRGENEATFQVTLLDSTAKLVAPDSLAAVNNLVYGLFEAGICEVSDTGVSIISIPIKDQLQSLFGTPLTALKAYTFGFGSDNDGKYVLCVPQTSADTYATRQHVFDTFGRTFCKWDLELTCGGVNPVNSKMYLGEGDSNRIKSERRQFDYTDYGDYGSTCTISAVSGTTLTIDNTSLMTAGDILYQGSTALAYIESVDAVSGTVVIDDTQTWTTGTADVTHVKAIDCQVEWNADYGGNAAGLKHYYECNLILKQAFQKDATLVFSSDVNPSEVGIDITSASGNGAFGQFEFGQEVFGGDQAKSPTRVGIPRGHARCNQLSVRFENRVAFSDFQLTGVALSFNATSTRTAR